MANMQIERRTKGRQQPQIVVGSGGCVLLFPLFKIFLFRKVRGGFFVAQNIKGESVGDGFYLSKAEVKTLIKFYFPKKEIA